MRSVVLREKNVPTLRAVVESLPVLPELEQELAASIGKAGEVLDSASPLLKELRSEARSAYQSLQYSLERTVRRLERQDILQESLITQRKRPHGDPGEDGDEAPSTRDCSRRIR